MNNDTRNILSALWEAHENLDLLMTQVEDLQNLVEDMLETMEDNADVLYICFSPERSPSIVLSDTGLEIITDEDLCMAQERTTGLIAFYAQSEAIPSDGSLCLIGSVLLAAFDDTGVPVSVTPDQFRAVQKLYAERRTVLNFGPASIDAIRLDVHEAP
jgi:hypothetical protein